MNNLFSSSWKRAGAGGDGDLESGGGGVEMTAPPGAAAGASLDRFFEDVESIKDDLRELERIQRSLHDGNESGKSLHDASAVRALRSRMDADVAAAIKKAKVVKLRLESLDRANAANRSVAGCGPGSSTDRTRTSVVAGLRKKLRDAMESFSSLRSRITSEYRDTVARRYFTVTGSQPDEATLDTLAETSRATSGGRGRSSTAGASSCRWHASTRRAPASGPSSASASCSSSSSSSSSPSCSRTPTRATTTTASSSGRNSLWICCLSLMILVLDCFLVVVVDCLLWNFLRL